MYFFLSNIFILLDDPGHDAYHEGVAIYLNPKLLKYHWIHWIISPSLYFSLSISLSFSLSLSLF